MSKYRTPHNLMRSVLDDTEYKNFCEAFGDGSSERECFRAAKNNNHSRVLFSSFVWAATKQDYSYWSEIELRITRER